MDGMSGQRYRAFINTLLHSMRDKACYLEIGVWKGSTLAAAIEGNRVAAVCIDNWSEFGGTKAEFERNVQHVQRSGTLRIIDSDFRAVDYSGIGSFNVFLFDGPHAEADQYDGIMVAQPALDDPHILIVDDWNWRRVRIGTFRALRASGWRVGYAREIRTTWNDLLPDVGGKDSDWHNGYFVAVLQDRRS